LREQGGRRKVLSLHSGKAVVSIARQGASGVTCDV
jgi:hypothetical protein